MIGRRAFLAGGVALIATSGLIVPHASAATGSIVTARALGLVNAYRAANGRGALAGNAVLGQAALEHSAAMAQSGRLNHNRFRARMRSLGISGSAAENVATGQADIAAAMASWQGSRGHRRNLLGGFTQLGVAVARDPGSGNRPYWTMILAE